MQRICALFIIAALCSCSNDVPDNGPNVIVAYPTTKLPRLDCDALSDRARLYATDWSTVDEVRADCILENARRDY